MQLELLPMLEFEKNQIKLAKKVDAHFLVESFMATLKAKGITVEMGLNNEIIVVDVE
jgi:hypothetical protein